MQQLRSVATLYVESTVIIDLTLVTGALKQRHLRALKYPRKTQPCGPTLGFLLWLCLPLVLGRCAAIPFLRKTGTLRRFNHRVVFSPRHRFRDCGKCAYAALRRLLIASSATLCLGLKISAKTYPTPTPTKQKVTAEWRSYSLFVAFSISTSLHALLRNAKRRTTLSAARTVPLYRMPFVSLSIHDSQGSRTRNLYRFQ